MFSEYLSLSLNLFSSGAQLLNQNMQYLLLFVLFAAVFVGTLGAVSLVGSAKAIQRRLSNGPTGAVQSEWENRNRRRPSGLSKFLERIGKRLVEDDGSSDTAQGNKFLQAGFYNKNAPALYYGWRLFLAFGLPGGFLFLMPVFSRNVEVNHLLATALGLAIFGFLAPTYYLSRRVSRRQLEAREGFPDALDMLLVCVEAGLSLDAAVNRVGKEIGHAHPVLGEQFEITALELRAGKARHDALKNLSGRIGIEEVATLVTLIVQSDLLGTSIAQTLRVHADEMRVKRMLRAEEKAHKLPVKLSIPLVMLILPALVIVILSPAIINIITDLMPVFTNTDFSVLGNKR